MRQLKQSSMVSLLFSMIIAMTSFNACSTPSNDSVQESWSNELTTDKMLLVLSAPSIHNSYYAPAFQEIVDFQIGYAKKILENDCVVVLVDEATRPYYEGKLPKDILLTRDVYDIWMRDFTTVNPENPVQFRYTWASMSEAQSKQVQQSFNRFANELGIERMKTDYLIDGGNIVDNYKGKVITTTRFMEDNSLSYNEAVTVLKSLLGANEVAILPPDEEALAHSDGMVSWIDDHVLLVNDYNEDAEYRAEVIAELKQAFPTTTIIEVPVTHKENAPGEWEGFSSACGVNLNATATYKNVYVPVFNMAHENEVLELMKKESTKTIIPVNAEGVCGMGGSVRCLTWQLTGNNAKRLILAARKGQ